MLRLKMYIIQYVLNITIVMAALTKVLSKPGLLSYRTKRVDG